MSIVELDTAEVSGKSTVDVMRAIADRAKEDEPEAAPAPELPEEKTPEPDTKEEPIKAEAAEKPARKERQRAKKEVVPEPEDDEPVVLPASLKAEDKEVFAKAPKDIQRAVARRLSDLERGTSRKIQELSTYQKFYEGLDEVIKPHVNSLQRRNIRPRDLIERAIAWDALGQEDPVSAVQEFARAHNVDLRQFAATPQQGAQQAAPVQQQQPFYDPRVDALQEQLSGVLGHVQTQQSQVQQQAANEAVAAWRTQKDEYGLEAHPYIEDLRDEIGAIVARFEKADPQLAMENPASLLEFAYNQALSAHPELRGAITRKREAAAARQRAEQAKNEANKARGAAVSIRGGVGSQTPNVNTRDTRELMAALARGEIETI